MILPAPHRPHQVAADEPTTNGSKNRRCDAQTDLTTNRPLRKQRNTEQQDDQDGGPQPSIAPPPSRPDGGGLAVGVGEDACGHGHAQARLRSKRPDGCSSSTPIITM